MKTYFTLLKDKFPLIACLLIGLLTGKPYDSSAQTKTDKDKPVKQKKNAKLPAEDLNGVMLAEAQYNFSPSALNGVSITNPTSLQFGPDGRLYVSQQNGLIKVFTIVRNGANSYSVTATETISLINGIPNYNDDGSLASTVTTRQVTGILVTGTAATPILYVGSSDSRIGGPSGDKNLDTNSGIISKLTKTSSGWDKIDLVRGLPRSEENHANNGMQLDAATNKLYVAVGGFTNAGSPSNNFAFICEYALSAAILSIDLNAINAMPTIGTGSNKYKYDLPTLDDPTRANDATGKDPNDPFGGNDGLNQAKIVTGGPVQIYSPGFRNAYDLVITKTAGKAGRMYTIDNGANQGWGGHPANEGAGGSVTNNYVSGEPGSNGPGPNDPQVNNLDNLHYIGNIATYVPGSHYGGHPTPTRANPAGAGLYTHSGTGVWRTSKTGTYPLPADWPPLPLDKANPIEGDYQNPGETDLALLTFGASTNGLVEYTASNFSNALKGDLLAAGYNGAIYKISLNDAGNGVLNLKGDKKINQDLPFASGFGSQPLDITAQGDTDIFPGTVWAATYGASAITVFEPQDFGTCSGSYSTSLDEDKDGFSNADEIDNATNPCSAASRPDDSDGDLISDLNDTDDDNDGLKDNVDFFALDASNGSTTNLPVRYDLFNNDPGTGLFGLGFTGLMSNGLADNDYAEKFDENNLIAGGAVGAFSVVAVTPGDALGTLNNQENAFQFGVNVNSGTGPFTVQSRMLINFFDNKTPQNFQSQGLYIGTGDQDNYLKVVLNANGGTPGLEVVYENAGAYTRTQYALGGLPSQSLDLFLSVNPGTGTVQPKYAKNGAAPVSLGSPITVSGSLLNAIKNTPALAVGIISTSRGAIPFTANWDFVYVTADPVTATGGWQSVVPSSGAPTARHESAYVQAGDKFYLMGGRGIKPVQIYNPATKTWTNGASTPVELHHFQAVTIDGLIYVVGAFTGSYPNETPVPNIYIYNPVSNTWITGPQIPLSRRRGSAGAVVYNNKIYLISGITNGHNSGHVTWMDEYDPATNTWKVLPNTPRARDHFHAAVAGSKLYAAGGRRTSASTGQTFTLTVGEVDVFDFTTQTWSTLPNNLPTQRAGTSVGILGEELLVIGGESGQTAAHNQTEALNMKTNTWRSLATLLQGRHGTQAIVNNNGIYVAAGSGAQGGSPELSTQEAFYLFSPTTPTGTALSASTLTAAPTSVAMGQVAVGSSKTAKVVLSNSSGNQGIVISSVTAGDNSFTVQTPSALPITLAPGKNIEINVTFAPASGGLKSTNLVVQHSGTGGSTTIALSGEGISQQQAAYLINAGGTAMTLSNKSWSADQYFTGGQTYANNNIADIAGTTDDALYKTERSSPTQQFSYNFPVSQAGTYTVKLHFAEIYFGATGGTTGGVGKRVFSVNLEGGTVELPNYDIYAEVGAMTAVVKTFNIAVNDGTLNIDFTATVNQPKVSAIEVIPASTSPVLSVTPTSLHFFSQQAGTTSAPQTLTLSNTGSTSLTVSGVTITGTNSSEFKHTFTSSISLAAGASTTVNVTFSPASLGTKTATLTITHTGSNPSVTVGLTGEGHNNPNQPPAVSLTSPSNGASFTAPATINLAANASDSDGSITKVEFFSGTTKLGEDLTSPYSFSWSSVAAGSYSLTAKATDNAGAVTTSAAVSVTVSSSTSACTASGSILREYWANVTGSISTIPVGTTPTSTTQLSSFEAPLNVADNYGQRVRGYICAPTTGSYTFYIASDDDSELWLSSSDNAANKQRIALVSGWTNSREWTKFASQKSVAITLQQGVRYYIEALHREGSGGDNLAVGWQTPTNATITVIPGSVLSPVTTTTANQAPMVSLTSPSNGASFTAPATITLSANASDSDGSITKVEFFSGTTKLGEDLTSPYSFSWSSVVAGSYSLTAKATDNAGAVTTSAAVSISVAAANQAPVVSLTSPANGASFTAPATINLAANASDSDGSITKVEFFSGTTKLGEDLTSPYSFSWSSVAAGSYSLTAKATDNAGAVTTSAAVSVTVSSSTSACTASGSILREYWANVTGSISTIPVGTTPTSTTQLSSFEAPLNVADNYGQRVRGYICAPTTGSYTFYIASDDDSELWLSSSDNAANKQRIALVSGWTNSREWTKFASQKSVAITLQQGVRYYIEALHREGSGGDNLAVGWQTPTNATITVIPGSVLSPVTTTTANQAPMVSLTSPSNGASFTAPATITLSANASDSDGSITKVEFFSGTTKLGEDLTSPYSFSWSSVVAGSYSLTAKATDNAGAVTTSAAVSVTVSSSTSACTASGSILREYWANVTGSISTIPVGTTPTSTTQLSSFEAPLNVADNYGQRVRGYICAPVTGSYTFYIASDDDSELWLSSSDNAANKQRIALVSGWTNSREWTKFASQKSVAITLQQGVRYYIEALHREGSGGDNLAVGWQTPTNATITVIPGSVLSPVTTTTANQAPMVSLTSPSNGASFTAPATITLSANASDSDGSITKVEFFSGTTKLGEDLTSPYSFSWSSVVAGSYSLTAKATDNAGAVTTSTAVSISVAAANQVPTVAISSPANGTSFTAPATINISANATDSDGTIAKVEFFNGSTKLGEDLTSPYSYSWSSVAAGSYSLTAKATDNAGAVTTSTAVSINVAAANQVPVVSAPIADQSATVGQPFSFSFAANTFTDADGDALSYTATLSNGAALPSWLSFTSGSRTFSGTPTSNNPASLTVRVTASDGKGGAVSDDFVISISAATNQVPVVSLTSPANGASFTAPATITLSANASDSDGSITKVEFFSGTTKLGEVLTSPYSYSWSSVAAGSYSLTAKATDNAGAVTTSAAVSVTVHPANQAPVVDAGADKTITLPVNTVTINGTATDPDGTISSYSWSQISGPAAATLSGASTATLTANDLLAGSYVFRLTVTDNGNATAFDEVTVTVHPAANQAPVVSAPIADQTAAVGQPFSFSFAANTFTDADGDALSYTATLADGTALPLWLSFTSGSRTFSGTPDSNNPASLTVKVTASDGKGGAVSDDFVISISAATNQAPVVSLTSPTNGASFTAPATITLSANASDSDGTVSKVEFYYNGNNKIGKDTDGSNGWSYEWTNVPAETYSLIAKATDNAGTVAISEVVTILVQGNVNRTPVVDAGADQQITLPVNTVTINGSATDPDGTISSYSWSQVSGPAAATLGGTTTATLTASDLLAGSYVFRLTVLDNGNATAFDEVTVTVHPAANQAPVVSLTSPANGASFTAPASIMLTAEATDSDGTIGKVEFFEGITKVGEVLAAPYSYSWSSVAAGSYSLTAKATDNAGAVTTSAAVSINVAAANQAPVVSAPIADQTATVGQPFSFSFAANAFTDADGDALSYTATLADGTALPLWLSFTSGSRTFSGTPDSNNPASLTVKVTASDGKGGIVSDEFNISIQAMVTGQTLVSFTLMNADTEKEIRTITEGDVLNLATLPTKNLNIRANTSPELVGSVVFKLSGTQSRNQTETAAPYALFGDMNGNYHAWTPALGNYSLTAAPYTSSGGGGTKGNELTVNFSVTDGAAKIAAAEQVTSEAYDFDIYPNPFATKTTLQFRPQQTDEYTLKIYDAQGALVKVIFSGEVEKDRLYTFELEASGLRSGVYMAQLSTHTKVMYKKLVLLK